MISTIGILLLTSLVSGCSYSTLIRGKILKESKTENLKGSKTEKNLKLAFASECQSNRKYLYYARKSDIEGEKDLSNTLKSIALDKTGHAFGHLDYLETNSNDETKEKLKLFIQTEKSRYEKYKNMAKTSRDEDLDEIADWFETTAKATEKHAVKFEKLKNMFENKYPK